MSAICLEQLYVVDVIKSLTSVSTIQLKRKVVSFDTWYNWLVYIDTDTIYTILSNNLANGLNIQEDLLISRLCKDCIFVLDIVHILLSKIQ